jgi:hypothetical protein
METAALSAPHADALRSYPHGMKEIRIVRGLRSGGRDRRTSQAGPLRKEATARANGTG